jgi:hypothetical protein
LHCTWAATKKLSKEDKDKLALAESIRTQREYAMILEKNGEDIPHSPRSTPNGCWTSSVSFWGEWPTTPPSVTRRISQAGALKSKLRTKSRCSKAL